MFWSAQLHRALPKWQMDDGTDVQRCSERSMQQQVQDRGSGCREYLNNCELVVFKITGMYKIR